MRHALQNLNAVTQTNQTASRWYARNRRHWHWLDSALDYPERMRNIACWWWWWWRRLCVVWRVSLVWFGTYLPCVLMCTITHNSVHYIFREKVRERLRHNCGVCLYLYLSVWLLSACRKRNKPTNEHMPSIEMVMRTWIIHYIHTYKTPSQHREQHSICMYYMYKWKYMRHTIICIQTLRWLIDFAFVKVKQLGSCGRSPSPLRSAYAQSIHSRILWISYVHICRSDCLMCVWVCVWLCLWSRWALLFRCCCCYFLSSSSTIIHMHIFHNISVFDIMS